MSVFVSSGALKQVLTHHSLAPTDAKPQPSISSTLYTPSSSQTRAIMASMLELQGFPSHQKSVADAADARPAAQLGDLAHRLALSTRLCAGGAAAGAAGGGTAPQQAHMPSALLAAQLRQHAMDVAAVAARHLREAAEAQAVEAGADGQHANAAAASCSPTAPDALPGWEAACDAAWAAAATASDMQLCLSALHDAPSLLARACRTGSCGNAYYALLKLNGAWAERVAAAGTAGDAPLLWDGGGCRGRGGASAVVCESAGHLSAAILTPTAVGCGCCESSHFLDLQREGQLLAKAILHATASSQVGGSSSGSSIFGDEDVPQAAAAAERRQAYVVVVRHALAIEVLRAMSWCMWVLGVLPAGAEESWPVTCWLELR